MEFRGLKWTDEKVLEMIASKNRLSSLDLFDTSVTDDGLTEIADRFQPTSLYLSSDRITSTGVRAVLKSPKLKSCMLSGAAQVDDELFHSLGSCRQLRELYLEGTGITDSGIAVVGELPELWSLVISNTKITDKGIASIASNSINLIIFSGCPISGNGFQTWSNKDKFSMYCENSALDPDGFIIAAERFPYMWNLILSNTTVDDRAMRHLSRPGPTSIRLDGTEITKDGALWLYHNTDVQGLTLDEGLFDQSEIDELNSESETGRYFRISTVAPESPNN